MHAKEGRLGFRFRVIIVGLLFLGPPGTAVGGTSRCPGDCDGDGQVAINELVTAVGIALGSASVTTCAAADSDGDQLVTINELVRAVGSALDGCPDDGELPDEIVVRSLNLQPEGIEYDAVGERFLVGSLTRGTVHAVADDGTLVVFNDDPGIASTVGLHIDRAHGRLLAAAAPTGGSDTDIVLAIYDLGTGETLRIVDLDAVAPAGPHLANDLTTDSAGNAYVTDSNTPLIYRVTPEGDAEVLVESPTISAANGIDIHDDRILIVALLPGPSLVRVPIDAPQALSLVETDVTVSGDGIAFLPNGDLAVVGGLFDPRKVSLFRSDDDWQSATLIDTWDSSGVNGPSPTTVAVRGEAVYAIFAHLFNMTREEYEIVRVPFDEP